MKNISKTLTIILGVGGILLSVSSAQSQRVPNHQIYPLPSESSSRGTNSDDQLDYKICFYKERKALWQQGPFSCAALDLY